MHTLRPTETWWNSYSKTIGKLMSTYKQILLPPHISATLDAWNTMAGDTMFSGRPTNRDTCLAAFNRNTQQMRDMIPANRLLVFDVVEGWAPLVKFLRVAVPHTESAHHNLRADFWEVLGGEPACTPYSHPALV